MASILLAVIIFSTCHVQAQPVMGRPMELAQPEFSQVAYISDCAGAYGEDCYPYQHADQYCGDHCDLDANCCDACCTQPWMHRSGIWGQFLYLHPTGADMHHAQQQNGTGGAGTVPFGVIGVTDPDFEPGYRIGGQVACNACTSIAINYTYLKSSAVDFIEPPGNVGGGLGTVGSLVHHPATVITGSAGPVDAQYDIKMQMADVDCRRLLHASDCAWMNYSVGARYGRLEQDFRQLGNFGGSQGGVIDTATSIDFDGGGLRLGLDGERRLAHGRWSAYGNASLSALVGSFRGNYLQHNATTVTDLAIVRWKDDRIAPILEYELGLAWTSCSGCLRAKVGYTGIHWFNTVTTPEFVDAVRATNYVDVGDTLSFSGLTSSVEWRY